MERFENEREKERLSSLFIHYAVFPDHQDWNRFTSELSKKCADVEDKSIAQKKFDTWLQSYPFFPSAPSNPKDHDITPSSHAYRSQVRGKPNAIFEFPPKRSLGHSAKRPCLLIFELQGPSNSGHINNFNLSPVSFGCSCSNAFFVRTSRIKSA